MTERLHFHFSLSCIGEGNGNPLQYSGLENPRDWGAWWAAIYGVAQSRTWLKWLSSSGSSIMGRVAFSLVVCEGKSTEVGCHYLLCCPWWVKPKTRPLHNPITQTQSTNIVLTIKMTKHPPFLLMSATDAALPITLFTLFHSSSIIDKIYSLRIICISWQHTVQSCFLFLEPFSKAPNTSLNLIINPH